MRADPKYYRKFSLVIKAFEAENVSLLLKALIDGVHADKKALQPLLRGYIYDHELKSFRFKKIADELRFLVSEQSKLIVALAGCALAESGELCESCLAPS